MLRKLLHALCLRWVDYGIPLIQITLMTAAIVFVCGVLFVGILLTLIAVGIPELLAYVGASLCCLLLLLELFFGSKAPKR